MNDEQLLRYSRHIMLAPIDVDGQQRLIDAHALIVGAGGLGAPAALYVASAGVGRITICDGDSVDLTNLQRQIIHRESTVGVNKALSAQRAIADINHDCRVIPVPNRVGDDELAALVADADVVLDCSDNFATRHAVNVACVEQKKPLVSGAAIRFSGQVVVFDPRRDEAPCYECLFPAGGGFYTGRSLGGLASGNPVRSAGHYRCAKFRALVKSRTRHLGPDPGDGECATDC